MDLCFEYIVNHLDTVCDTDSWTKNLKLKRHVTLPVETCEKLLNLRMTKPPKIDNSFIGIFLDREATRLKRIKLRNTDIDNEGLEILMHHLPVELEISQCLKLQSSVTQLITLYSHRLQSLTIGDATHIFPSGPTYRTDMPISSYLFHAPHLRRLSLRNIDRLRPEFFMSLLSPMLYLTHLDLSNCKDLGELTCIEHLDNMTSLILYNMNNLPAAVPAICKLTHLRHLDISQSLEDSGKYERPNQLLATIVESLPGLTSLDISGTNLAGSGVAESIHSKNVDDLKKDSTVPISDIHGLSSRMSNPFQFLGLYETQHDACLRHDIPAKLIAGNANEEQILVAALAYLDRTDMLQKVLNELFHLFRYESCAHVGQALNIVLEAMNRHLTERHIQISGSATLFYIVKGSGAELHDVIRVKRRIITALLNGMSEYRYDDTMMRNGCLTLCQFKIPWDVIFDYERLVLILLHSVHGMHQENFVQRIGIYLLNSLACQVDGAQKVKLGELGAIDKMLWLISDRLDRQLCDDVLEVAWSTMWNVTDETPANCRRFLVCKGMVYFLKCLEAFPDKEELLRNMMGLLGNVAEVFDLRFYLMEAEYIQVFSNLLESVSDGMEVSYNAAGVLSHIASDGPGAWTVAKPSRDVVLSRLLTAVERWDLNSQRNINYRSFEPILGLARVYDTPACQQWAVWALANLTKVYPNKYCDLVEKEGGIALLQEIIDRPEPSEVIKILASTVITNCQQFKSTQLDG